MENNKETILIVENNEAILALLQNILSELNCRLLTANTSSRALAICRQVKPDLILIDLSLPDQNGFETAISILDFEKLKNVPIIFTSSITDTQNLLRCFESGGVDYIIKPFNRKELIARVSTHLSLTKIRQELQTDRDHLVAILSNMLPAHVIRTLKNRAFPQPEWTEKATVIFTDFKNFTSLSKKLGSRASVYHLNLIYYVFDEIINSFSIERVKTIGDAYLAVAGINTKPENLYLNPVLAAFKMQEFIAYYNTLTKRPEWQLRIGIATGPVTSGVIGFQKIAYDVWGNTVNMAHRLEKASRAGHVALGREIYQKVKLHVNSDEKEKITDKPWNGLQVHHCSSPTGNLPSKIDRICQQLDPGKLLEEAYTKKNLFNKVFRLSESAPFDLEDLSDSKKNTPAK